MAQITTLNTLDYTINGFPVIARRAKSTLDLTLMDYTIDGFPAVATQEAVPQTIVTRVILLFEDSIG